MYHCEKSFTQELRELLAKHGKDRIGVPVTALAGYLERAIDALHEVLLEIPEK